MPILVRLILLSTFELLNDDYKSRKVKLKPLDSLLYYTIHVLNEINIMLYKVNTTSRSMFNEAK